MITVGLVKELYFISKVLKETYCLSVFPQDSNGSLLNNLKLVLNITPEGELTVWYKGIIIWKEKVDGDDSFFGVESCDTISRIIACINNKDFSWKEKYPYIIK